MHITLIEIFLDNLDETDFFFAGPVETYFVSLRGFVQTFVHWQDKMNFLFNGSKIKSLHCPIVQMT